MAEKSIIIIGAGLAGLATGSYAQMNGYRSRIFEHHYEPGGVAIAWEREGYLIDGGIHYLIGHKPGQAWYDLYRELGIFKNRQYPDLTREAGGSVTGSVSGWSVSGSHLWTLESGSQRGYCL